MSTTRRRMAGSRIKKPLIEVITTSQDITINKKYKYLSIFLLAGGGGGGEAYSVTSGATGGGGGGGGGDYLYEFDIRTLVFDTLKLTIGSGGAGGASGSGAKAGGNSIANFDDVFIKTALAGNGGDRGSRTGASAYGGNGGAGCGGGGGGTNSLSGFGKGGVTRDSSKATAGSYGTTSNGGNGGYSILDAETASFLNEIFGVTNNTTGLTNTISYGGGAGGRSVNYGNYGVGGQGATRRSSGTSAVAGLAGNSGVAILYYHDVPLESGGADSLLITYTSNPGVEQTSKILTTFKYVDILIFGGGTKGGNNVGYGGACGTAIYAKNVVTSRIANKQITYNLATADTSGTGKSTTVTIDGNTIVASGGNGGIGGLLNEDTVVPILSNYVEDPSKIAIANNGGGASGLGGGSEASSGGSGSSFQGTGYIANGDGTGGYSGGNGRELWDITPKGGAGYKLNNVIIPISSVFGGGGMSGRYGASGYAGGNEHAGGGGGAAGYGSGGNGGDYNYGGAAGGYGAGGGGAAGSVSENATGGSGGQGIICLYYHN